MYILQVVLITPLIYIGFMIYEFAKKHLNQLAFTPFSFSTQSII